MISIIKIVTKQLRDPRRMVASFASMQSGVFLILFLCALSAYGSFLPHSEAIETVYSSWWYISLFSLAALNLSACTLRRLQRLINKSGIPGRGNISTTPLDLSAYSYRFEIDKSSGRQVSPNNAAEILKKNNYRLQDLKSVQGEAIIAEKGRIGIYGSLITHLALLIILAAAYYGVLTGNEDLARGFPGDIVPVSIGSETLKLEIADFYIDYRDDGSVNQYYSELILRDEDPEGPPLAHNTIHINSPLRYGKKSFYLSGYGWGVDTYMHHPPSEKTVMVRLIPGKEYYFAPARITLQLLNFYPDPARDKQGHLFSRSPEPRNPHVLFRLLDQENQVLGPPAQLQNIGESVELPQLEFIFTEFHNSTGILVKENRATSFVLFGAAVFLIGLLMSFYIQPRQILLLWAAAREGTGKLTIYGWSHTDRPSFAIEFYEIVNTIVSGRSEPS